MREVEQQRAVEADLTATVPLVEHCAQAAMAALMLVCPGPRAPTWINTAAHLRVMRCPS